MFCAKCGKEYFDGAEFCVSCGNQTHNVSQMGSGSNIQTKSKGSPVFAILGWVFIAISLLFFPILFAAGGFIFGYLHRKVNQTHGTIIMVLAVAGGLFGTLIGAVIGSLYL